MQNPKFYGARTKSQKILALYMGGQNIFLCMGVLGQRSISCCYARRLMTTRVQIKPTETKLAKSQRLPIFVKFIKAKGVQ